jgi:hypothetical protein
MTVLAFTDLYLHLALFVQPVPTSILWLSQFAFLCFLFGVLKTVEKKIVTYYLRPTVRIMNRSYKAPKLSKVTAEELGCSSETQVGTNYVSFLN